MKNVFKNRLTDKYHFVDKSSITALDMIDLQSSIMLDSNSEKDWDININLSLAIVGVRDINERLVGVAFLAGNYRHAVFCDLTVNPEFQHIGIGESIMYKIMEEIERLEIFYVYTDLAETNPFKEKMIQSGFKDTGCSLFLDA